MVENDVVEVGEEEDKRILSAPKKKALGTRKKGTPRNPKAVAPKKVAMWRQFLFWLSLNKIQL